MDISNWLTVLQLIAAINLAFSLFKDVRDLVETVLIMKIENYVLYRNKGIPVKRILTDPMSVIERIKQSKMPPEKRNRVASAVFEIYKKMLHLTLISRRVNVGFIIYSVLSGLVAFVLLIEGSAQAATPCGSGCGSVAARGWGLLQIAVDYAVRLLCGHPLPTIAILAAPLPLAFLVGGILAFRFYWPIRGHFRREFNLDQMVDRTVDQVEKELGQFIGDDHSGLEE